MKPSYMRKNKKGRPLHPHRLRHPDALQSGGDELLAVAGIGRHQVLRRAMNSKGVMP